MNEKKYDEDGYLIISETDSCSLWEKDTIPSAFVCTKDCFYCAFSNFRQDEYMQSLGDKEKGEKLYSVCHNEHKYRRKHGHSHEKDRGQLGTYLNRHNKRTHHHKGGTNRHTDKHHKSVLNVRYVGGKSCHQT